MAFTTRQAASEDKSAQQAAVKPSVQLFNDQRASTSVQLKQQQLMQAAQSPAQFAAEEEEPLQGKFATAQLAEEEELLQGKFGTAQLAEEEELLQGKFSTTQLMEEEEPLQGKFETAQLAEEEELLQGKFSNTATAQLEEKPNNTGLPNQLKSGIESLSGMSLDGVKVHYNSDKPAQLNAHAYAQGTDIHVAPGQEQHLPHEAWHVVQQAQGRVKPTRSVDGVSVNDNPALESEATAQGERALQTRQSAPAQLMLNTASLVAQLKEPADYRQFLQLLAAAGYQGASKAHVPHKGSEVKSHYYSDKIEEARAFAAKYPNVGVDLAEVTRLEGIYCA